MWRIFLKYFPPKKKLIKFFIQCKNKIITLDKFVSKFKSFKKYTEEKVNEMIMQFKVTTLQYTA
jgi:hypothetical protein